MAEVLFIIFIASVVAYCDFKISKPNWGAVWNGVGAVPEVLKGDFYEPMQFRVLVPWLCRLFGKKETWQEYVGVYVGVKWAGILFAIVACYSYFGSLGLPLVSSICLLALWLVWISMYDYADVYYELGFLAVSLLLLTSGAEWALLATIPIVILAALNRETAILIPVIACFTHGVMGGGLLGFAFLVGYAIPRVIYHSCDRYCSLIMIKKNIKNLRAFVAKPIPINEYWHLLLLVIIGIALFCVTQLTYLDWIMAVFFGLMLIPSMWREVRVFTPVMLVLIPKAVGVL